MSKNKMQFQRGMSLHEFMARYGTAAQCAQPLFAWRWPQGFVCPACGDTRHCTLQSRQLFQCNACGRQTSVTAGTVFAGSKLALNVWFLAMHLITQAKNGISSLELSRQLGISQNSAWLMKHKLMQAMLGARTRAAAFRPGPTRRRLLGWPPPWLQARAWHARQDPVRGGRRNRRRRAPPADEFQQDQGVPLA
jgi:transposase-like protein